MDINDQSSNAVSILCGICATLLGSLLKVDMHTFYTQVLKSGEVLWLGILGGMGGYVGKILITKILKHKKSKP